MRARRNLPCNPKLDSMLESYFSGPSIKSILDITARGTTSPTAIKRVDVNAEIAKLMRNLTAEERREIELYYLKRAYADEATHKASDARREARNTGKRRKFRTGIAEVERCYQEKKRPRR